MDYQKCTIRIRIIGEPLWMRHWISGYHNLVKCSLTLSSSIVHTMYHIIYLSYSMVVLYLYHNFRLRYRCSIEVQFLSQFVEGFQVLLPTNRSQKFVFLKNLSRSAIELLACVLESCVHATTTYFPAKSLCLKELKCLSVFNNKINV